MVLVLFLFGSRCFGAADYFMIGEQEFFVRTLFFHIWFIPLCPMKSFISKSPGNGECEACTQCNNSYVVQLPSLVCKTVLWAWIRFFAFLIPPLWPLVFMYKPKASPERREVYVQALGRVVAAARANRQQQANVRVVAQTIVEPPAPIVGEPPAPIVVEPPPEYVETVAEGKHGKGGYTRFQ